MTVEQLKCQELSYALDLFAVLWATAMPSEKIEFCDYVKTECLNRLNESEVELIKKGKIGAALQAYRNRSGLSLMVCKRVIDMAK